MESNIIGNYDYNQLIIKRDNKNQRKILIPTRNTRKNSLNINKKCKKFESSLHQFQTQFLPPSSTLPITSTCRQTNSHITKDQSKMSINFDLELMKHVLPWTYLSNSLRDAARDGNLNLVIELIKNGADVNEADRFGTFNKN